MPTVVENIIDLVRLTNICSDYTDMGVECMLLNLGVLLYEQHAGSVLTRYHSVTIK